MKPMRPLLCTIIMLASACTTQRVTTSDGWPLPPQPRHAAQPAAGVKAERMAFMVGSKADDTNNNGYPDLIKVSVSLFSSQHPTAIEEDGSFIFSLYPQGQVGSANARTIAQWRMNVEQQRRALAYALAGPCYLFQLSLLEVGSDHLNVDEADMVCRFEPAGGGTPISSDGVRTIQVGRGLAALK